MLVAEDLEVIDGYSRAHRVFRFYLECDRAVGQTRNEARAEDGTQLAPQWCGIPTCDNAIVHFEDEVTLARNENARSQGAEPNTSSDILSLPWLPHRCNRATSRKW